MELYDTVNDPINTHSLIIAPLKSENLPLSTPLECFKRLFKVNVIDYSSDMIPHIAVMAITPLDFVPCLLTAHGLMEIFERTLT